MGGDDLGSDDEYFVAPIRAPEDDEDDVVDDDNDIDKKGKRKLVGGDDDNDAESDEGEEEEEQQPSNKQKKKKRKREKNELRELGMRIDEESVESQAKLLSQFAEVTFHPQHIAKPNNSSSTTTTITTSNHNMMDRITNVVSKKQLKKYNYKGSPMIYIVCLSARRCVQILKELAPLRIRAVKLFAKHISFEEQKSQLSDSSFGFAVGTPHRILALARDKTLGDIFKNTRLVVLDTFPNPKNFSVYTLPDTVPPTKSLLKEYVYPQCNRRKDIRVAFV